MIDYNTRILGRLPGSVSNIINTVTTLKDLALVKSESDLKKQEYIPVYILCHKPYQVDKNF